MRSRAGFSLVELMVGLVIFGLVAGFSVPALNKSLSRWNLKTAHNTCISELKLLRQKAIGEGRSYRIWFSPGSRFYWFQDPETLLWTPYLLPERTAIVSANFNGFFDTQMTPDGRVTRSGMVVLTNNLSQLDTVQVDLNGWVGRP